MNFRVNPHILVIGLAFLGLGLFSGCSEANLIDRVNFNAPDYNRVYENSTQVLRENRFPAARQDRRFGYVASKPVVASHLFNSFRGDNSTFYQMMESSGNHQRRIIRIWLRPLAAGPEEVAEPELRQKILAYRAGFALDDEGNVMMPTTQQAPDIFNEPYELRVEVMIQRGAMPHRQLGNGLRSNFPAASKNIEREIPEYWSDFREDPELANRITREIAKRSGLVVPQAYVDED